LHWKMYMMMQGLNITKKCEFVWVKYTDAVKILKLLT
jgi:hypothetical protein